MISVEIRVNGSLIAAANVVNRGYQSPGASDMCEYECASTLFPMDNGTPDSRHFHVKHHRNRGALALIEKVVKAMMIKHE